ncbi:MAG: hypothetical protein NTZ05_12440 [Chloroflexi bacterium]|nr:hypothetical protein [Chloroflexota bacterium]
MDELLKLAVTGLFSTGCAGAVATVVVGWLNRRESAAKARQIVATTDQLEQEVRARLTGELNELHERRRADGERMDRLETELTDVRRQNARQQVQIEQQQNQIEDLTRRLHDCEERRGVGRGGR